MALFEIVVFACDTFAVLGKLLLAIFSVALDALKIISLSALTCFDYLHVAVYLLGLLLCDVAGFVFPFLLDFLLFSFNFTQSAVEYTVNTIFDYSLAVWTTSAFVNLRENFIQGVCEGGQFLLEAAIKSPIFAVKFLLVILWVVLLLTYWTHLVELFCQMGIFCLNGLISTRNFALFCLEEAVHWAMAPVRAVAFLPTKAKQAAGAFWSYASSWRQSCAPSSPPSDGASKVAIRRGPSLFRRLQKTDSAESLERLNNHVRELQTKLEEERESKLCIICQSNFRAIVCMPCKHFATCEECMTLLPVNILSRKVCPVCRTQINATIKVYL